MILAAMIDNNPIKKKKAKRDKQTSLFTYKNNPAQLNQVLSSLYVGKRVLLTAVSLYGRRIPAGKEEMLFQYHIGAVNSNNKTATMEYNRSASKMPITCFNCILTNKIQPSQTTISSPLQRITSAF